MSIFKQSAFALGVASLVVLGANTALADSDKCSVNGPIISVTGYGKVKAMPDQVALNYRVSSIKDSADAARQEVEKTVTAFSNEYTKLKLNKDYFVADNISISPRYEYKDKDRILIGYEASRNVVVKLDDFSLISKVNDMALATGINQINGFDYTLKDPKKFKDEANKKAIADAIEQSQLLANGFGVKIVQPCQISFNNYVAPIYNRAVKANLAYAEAAPVESTYTSTALEITSTVQASFTFTK